MKLDNFFIKIITLFIVIIFSLILFPDLTLASEWSSSENVECHSWSSCSPGGAQTRNCYCLWDGDNCDLGEISVQTRDCPIFNKIEPEIIIPGEIVTITGENFGQTKGDSYVALVEIVNYDYINNFKVWSNNEIQFYAPKNISADEIQVRIGDRYGNYYTFDDYYVQPNIESFEPNSGYSGDKVRIELDRHPNEIFPDDVIVNNFLGENIKNEVTIDVYFNDKKISDVTSDRFGYYNVEVPQGASTGKIKVVLYTPSSPKIEAISSKDFIVKDKIDCSTYGKYAYYDEINEECGCKWGYKWNDNKSSCVEDIKELPSGDDPDNDGVPTEKDLFPEEKSEVVTRNYSFQYTMPGDSRGDYVNFKIDIPKDLYFYYQNENHVFSEGFDNITTFVTKDDPVIVDIANQILKYWREQDLNPVALVHQLVGEIIYTDDKFSIKGWDEYPKYPIETILEKKGDCEDTSFLMASLLKALGLSDPLLVKFDNHLGVAVIASKDMIDSVIKRWGEDFMYEFNKNLKKENPDDYYGLIYLETTGNAYWTPGYMPEELRSKEYEIIPIYDNSINNNEISDNNIEDNRSNDESIIQREKNLVKNVDENLSKRIKGKILLQVEDNGEGWYVNPDDERKYYLGRPLDAIRIMKELGLGISEDSFNSFNGYAPKRLAGKILLRVEANGEAYYVDPEDLKMHYLGRPKDAFEVMRNLGLGISNNDIRKIRVGEI